MDRESTIAWLIDDDLNDWNSEDDKNSYITRMLLDGFGGYNNMTDEELNNEMHERLGWVGDD